MTDEAYDIALRPDSPPSATGLSNLMDDIVVNNVEMFRAEQMDTGVWWVCCYLRGGARLTFNVQAKCRPRRLEWRVTEYPDGDFIYEEPRPC